MKKSRRPSFQGNSVKTPHANDILLGRGGASIHNDANVRYRSTVREYKKVYQTYTRFQKTELAVSLVKNWQKQNPPGRFLEKDESTGMWYCISEKSARRKTSQLLREGAPKIRRQLKDEAVMKSPRTIHGTPVSAAVAASAVPTPVVTKRVPPVTEEKQQPEVAPAPVAATPVRSAAKTEAPETGRVMTPPPLTTQQPPERGFMTPPPSHENQWPPAHWWPPYHHHHNPNPYASPQPYYYNSPPPYSVHSHSSSTSSTPLKPITPADENQQQPKRTPAVQMKTKSTQTAPDKPVIKKVSPSSSPTKPPPTRSFMERATSSTALSKPSPITERKISFSPESVLDFELSELPITSFDYEKEEDDDEEPMIITNNLLESLDLPPLSSPLGTPTKLPRKDTLETWPSSFSWDSSNNSFDDVNAILNKSDSLDILDDLDKGLEDEFMLTPCPSMS